MQQSQGKTISIYLMDGTSEGRWKASLANWNGVGYRIPRDEVKNCGDIADLKKPGVYFLFGNEIETGRTFIYIGEADAVRTRIMQPHTFEERGDSWTDAVIFVTTDDSLEKGRVKYLENRFYTLAVDAGRYLVRNGNTPKHSPVSAPVRDTLEGFISNVRLVLPTMGYRAFDPLPVPLSAKAPVVEKESDLLYFSRKNKRVCNAVCRMTDQGFLVFKGSSITPDVAPYATGVIRSRTENAASIGSDGILVNDILFRTASAASSFVCGGSSNGLVDWKNRAGVSLKKIMDDGPEKCRADLLHLSGRGIEATGYEADDGRFVVCKGSGFSMTEVASCPKKKLRAELIAEGKVKNGVFTEDVSFKSKSSAAGCVLGASVDGVKSWK